MALIYTQGLLNGYCVQFLSQLNLLWSYSVVVITIGFDPIDPRSNRGRTFFCRYGPMDKAPAYGAGDSRFDS